MSPFAAHITEMVNRLSLARDRTETGKALIRERAMEARHLAERLRTNGSGLPGIEGLIEEQEARGKTLDAIADQWPHQFQKKVNA